MKSYRAVIDAWPSLSDFAADIGVRYGTAQVMRYRGHLPDVHWIAAVRAAERRGIDGVTLELLAGIAAARRKKKAREQARESRVA